LIHALGEPLKTSFRFFLFQILTLALIGGCQQQVSYRYLSGEGRCANGKQDPDEFGVDCGGVCPESCKDVRYLEGEIFGRLSLDTRYDYILTGPLIVRDQGALELPSGTHLKVQADAGAYIAVVQGGLFFAWGTVENPVTISSNAPEPNAGDWGGIIFCGQAPIGDNDRKLSPIGNYYYGGDQTNDVSGYLRYLKIQHAGAAYDDFQNFSAIGMYGVGRYTVMDHVWIDDVLYNGIEIVGGTIGFEEIFVQYAQENALSITSNWAGLGSRLYLHQSGANGILVQDTLEPFSTTSSSTLQNVSIIHASESGLRFSSRLGHTFFDKFIIADVPTGILFLSETEEAFPFQAHNFYFQNIGRVSNNEVFNTQFNGLDVPPFSNGSALPEWLSHWSN